MAEGLIICCVKAGGTYVWFLCFIRIVPFDSATLIS